MTRPPLSARASDELLRRIITGELPAGQELPPEADLAETLGVSRLTVREALKILQSQGVVQTIHGRRGVVNPASMWTSLDPRVKETVHRLGAEQVSLQLLEMRRMIEVGSASLAAGRRTEADLAAMRHTLDTMDAACRDGDLDAFVSSDIAFHEAVFAATRNEFVGLVFQPLHAVLLERRRETSSAPQVQVNALACHRAVHAAIDAGQPDAARDAMSAHMDQTERDLRQLLAEAR